MGHIDIDTREWTDGVLTFSARQVVKEPSSVHSWIICDGDIDPEWIESLNSVLDDNRLLTMPSGERIQFGPNVNFLFESHDLSCASPATISRMGMIFMRCTHHVYIHVCMHCICISVSIHVSPYTPHLCVYKYDDHLCVYKYDDHLCVYKYDDLLLQ